MTTGGFQLACNAIACLRILVDEHDDSFSSASSPLHDCSGAIRFTASPMTEALPYGLA